MAKITIDSKVLEQIVDMAKELKSVDVARDETKMKELSEKAKIIKETIMEPAGATEQIRSGCDYCSGCAACAPTPAPDFDMAWFAIATNM